jgi:hypothetical protein
MPRGRHRHAPPLHRLLAPSAVAAAALACAGGAWLAHSTLSLRILGTGAAAAAVAGAVLLRHWDRAAGRRVGEVRASKASLEWQAEERQAELEDDLDEAREIRHKLENKLRQKRTELNRLRTEHAALLRRYATAETERARALEGRRQLAIAAAEPSKELTTGATDHRKASGAPTPLTYLQANEALKNLRRNAVRQAMSAQEQAQSQQAQSQQAQRQQVQGESVQQEQQEVEPVGEREPVQGHERGQEQEQETTEEPGSHQNGFDYFGATDEAEAEPDVPIQSVRRQQGPASEIIDLAEPA